MYIKNMWLHNLYDKGQVDPNKPETTAAPEQKKKGKNHSSNYLLQL